MHDVDRPDGEGCREPGREGECATHGAAGMSLDTDDPAVFFRMLGVPEQEASRVATEWERQRLTAMAEKRSRSRRRLRRPALALLFVALAVVGAAVWLRA